MGKKSENERRMAPLLQYDTSTSKIMIYSQIYFGKQMWKLNIQYVPLETTKGSFRTLASTASASGGSSLLSLPYYSFFAYFLLTGEIFPELKEIKSTLKEQPSAILDDGNMSEKVTSMLAWLQKFDIDSK